MEHGVPEVLRNYFNVLAMIFSITRASNSMYWKKILNNVHIMIFLSSWPITRTLKDNKEVQPFGS